MLTMLGVGEREGERESGRERMNLKVATVGSSYHPHGWKNKRKRLELLKFRNVEEGPRAETQTSEEGDLLSPL